MSHSLLQLLLRWSVLALGVTIAAKGVPGLRCDDIGTLVVVVLLLSFENAVLRPLLVLLTLPVILITMGLGVVLINALLFLLVGRIVDGFEVASFWSALGGALIVGVTNIVMNSLLGKSAARSKNRDDNRRPPRGGDDVIDV